MTAPKVADSLATLRSLADRVEAIDAATDALFSYNTTDGLHFVIHNADSGYRYIAKVAYEAMLPLIGTRNPAPCAADCEEGCRR